MGSEMDPIKIGILSLVWNNTIDTHLIQRLRTIKIELQFIQLKPRDLHEFSPPSNLHAVILLHPFTEGRLSLTDVKDARYSTLLPTLSSHFGSYGVCVIAYLIDKLKESTEQTHLKVLKQNQPTVFEKSHCVILCGKLEDLFQRNIDEIREFMKFIWRNTRKSPWQDEWIPKAPTQLDVVDKQILNADNACTTDEVKKDSRDELLDNGNDKTPKTDTNSEYTGDSLSTKNSIQTNDEHGIMSPSRSSNQMEDKRSELSTDHVRCQRSDDISDVVDQETEETMTEPTDGEHDITSPSTGSNEMKDERREFSRDHDRCQISEEIGLSTSRVMDNETDTPTNKLTVLVTDASGFIASHIVQQLTQSGYKVRGTLNRLDKPLEVGTLRELSPEIDLFEADSQSDKWVETVSKAVTGCTYVIHTSRYQDNRRSTQGDVTTLLKVCQHVGGIKRVVLTGLSEFISEQQFKYKEWWSIDCVLKDAISKNVSEKAALEFMQHHTEKPTFELSIIKPPVVLGPILCNPAEANVEIVGRRMVNASSGSSDISIPVCDVRDVAKAHIMALSTPKAVDRNPGVALQSWSLKKMANTLKNEFEHQGYTNIPWKYVRTRLSGWDETSQCVDKLYGSRTSFEQTAGKVLVEDVIDKKKSVIDMAYSCIERGFIKKMPGYRPRHEETTDVNTVHRAGHTDFDQGMGDG